VTPVVARDKSLLRYATVLERHVGTQTDCTWPVSGLPEELENALSAFTVDDVDDSVVEFGGEAAVPHPAWKTPGQRLVPPGAGMVRSSSPKSFEKRLRLGGSSDK
jgi:hypothetical protein